MEKTATPEPAAPAALHTKEQLLSSARYANRRDLLGALLENGKAYTIAEADRAMNDYLKGQVK